MGEKNNQTQPIINRTYKDSLFRMIFCEKQNLLQLYNALNGTNHDNIEDLEIVTLENAIYMNMKNDVAQKSLYSSVKIQIPNPYFIVFYNGTAPLEECTVLKLSDLYCHSEETPELELTVRMLNINKGYNDTITKQCKLLSEYMQYVDKVRIYTEHLTIQEAVEKTVKECLDEGILVEFLDKYRREAIQVSIFEYDEEKELRLLRQAEREYALEQGFEQGRQQGIQQSREDVIRSLMETMKLSLSQAMDALQIPAEDQAMYEAKIGKQ